MRQDTTTPDHFCTKCFGGWWCHLKPCLDRAPWHHQSRHHHHLGVVGSGGALSPSLDEASGHHHPRPRASGDHQPPNQSPGVVGGDALAPRVDTAAGQHHATKTMVAEYTTKGMSHANRGHFIQRIKVGLGLVMALVPSGAAYLDTSPGRASCAKSQRGGAMSPRCCAKSPRGLGMLCVPTLICASGWRLRTPGVKDPLGITSFKPN